MKKTSIIVVLICAICATAFFAFAPSAGDTTGSTGQMYNVSNVYNNISSTGKFIDTVYGATAYIGTTRLLKGSVNADTFNYAPVFGYGTISLTASALQANGGLTPTINVTPQKSFDGNVWVNVPGATVATLTPTSTTVPSTVNWEFSIKYADYYRLKCVVTDTASLQCFYYAQKVVYLNRSIP